VQSHIQHTSSERGARAANRVKQLISRVRGRKTNGHFVSSFSVVGSACVTSIVAVATNCDKTVNSLGSDILSPFISLHSRALLAVQVSGQQV
jgi:hypothetical protein